MDSNKETGSYYTPYDLVGFMVSYLRKNSQSFASVLEPSAGDGRFLSVLMQYSEQIKAIELFEDKVVDIKNRYKSSKLKVLKRDFLDYVEESKESYSLIIGNPPYINPKVMGIATVEKAKKICEKEKIDTSVMQNMWIAFVIGACRLLEENGTIFFVLPMEFLQVQYAEKLRFYLEDKFNTIHIISFQEVIFPEIEQEVCLLYLTNRSVEIPYILYEIYENTKKSKLIYSNKIQKSKPLKKWSNAILSDEDIWLLKKNISNYHMIKGMGESAPGIVTGGNKFFIITEEKVKECKCEQYVLPILQKSSFISTNTISIDNKLITTLNSKKKPAYLLNLSSVKEENMPKELKEYLAWVKEQNVGDKKIIECFKCANRTPWYGVPIVNKGDVIFFKRYHMVPRVYINYGDIHTTDAGYHIRLKTEWDKASFVFCFYNSLTLAQCEFQGRYYGGGVSELVPSEFKELCIPYREIEDKDIKKLDKMFKEKLALEKIVSFVNSKTIELDMKKEDVERIEEIRKKLIKRRCKK